MATNYVFQPGDSLWSVAEKFYGDGNQWPAIYEANRSIIGANPDLVQDGIMLYIPDLASNAVGSQTYVTKDNDTLWDMAARFYGDGNQWNRIFEANRDVINDPNVIYGGMQLTIPT
jgi:nucleoid-associated protein YgaU